MSHNNIESKVETLLEPIVHNLEYELYDVQYVKEGKDYYLRITIDKLDGISIEDCEKVNRVIDPILDEADIIATSYFLEVSSPGLERILRKPSHFEKQIGNEIQVKFFKPLNGKKELQGTLKSYTANELELEMETEIVKIENKNIAMVKTVAKLF